MNIKCYKNMIIAGAMLALYSSADLIGFWTFDELVNGQFTDVAGSVSNNATPLNVVGLDAARKISGTASFNCAGTNYLTVAHGADINITGDAITITALIYPRAGNDQIIVSKTEPMKGSYLLRLSGGKIHAGIDTDSDGWVMADEGEETLALNQWHFVAMVYDGENLHRYLNGELYGTSASASGNLTEQVNVDLTIGALGDYTGIFSGNIDDLKIHNTALSAQEIQTEYQQYWNIRVVGYWPLDALENNNFNDYGGLINDSASTNTNSETFLSNESVLGDGCVYCNDGYMAIQNSREINIINSNMLLSAWIKYSDSSVYQQGIFGKSIAGNAPFLMRLHYGKFECGLQNEAETWHLANDGAVLLKDVWHNVIMVYNGSSITRYVDGAQYGSVITATGSVRKNTYDAGIGASGGTGYQGGFHGYIDDVMLMADSLSDDQIQCLFDIGNSSELRYGADLFFQLLLVHEETNESFVANDLTWKREENLNYTAGLHIRNGRYVLVFDSINKTGVSATIPIMGTIILVQ